MQMTPRDVTCAASKSDIERTAGFRRIVVLGGLNVPIDRNVGAQFRPEIPIENGIELTLIQSNGMELKAMPSSGWSTIEQLIGALT